MPDNQIELFIFDRDPIFRLGLATALTDYPEFSVELAAATTEEVFNALERGMSEEESTRR